MQTIIKQSRSIIFESSIEDTQSTKDSKPGPSLSDENLVLESPIAIALRAHFAVYEDVFVKRRASACVGS